MATETKTYKGWTNYETWNVALWLDNEDPSYRERQRLAQYAWEAATEPSANARLTGSEPFTREERAVFLLAASLKEMVGQANPLNEMATMYSDLLGAALSEVNWHEIAEKYLEEVEKAEVAAE